MMEAHGGARWSHGRAMQCGYRISGESIPAAITAEGDTCVLFFFFHKGSSILLSGQDVR